MNHILYQICGTILSDERTDKSPIKILNFDCNEISTNNHLVHNRTLNHLAKLALNEYILLCVFIMSHTRFRVNVHS